uniref:Sulfatase-modifying factor enzyme-like domain-containing protein n=1 Tax=Chlorobium chlorochromatii (strain CaD3) TaxID=340177 RepID=Q3ANU9_CHLCH
MQGMVEQYTRNANTENRAYKPHLGWHKKTALLVTLFLTLTALFSLPQTTLAAVNTVPPNFVLIRGGEFTMGSPESESERDRDEMPHRVKVGDFYIARYEVTTAEFRTFVQETGYRTDAEKTNPSLVFWSGLWPGKAGLNWRYGTNGKERSGAENNHPVILVSWNDAVAYCKWLSKKHGMNFRLPTSAEWEYACRAGTSTVFNYGDNLSTTQANYDGNYPYSNHPKGIYRKNTVPVNSFTPNAWGLYNMHGNVAEWCSDWYSEPYYESSKANGTVTNPTGPATGSNRVMRGGSWYDDARYCRSADINDSTPSYRYINVGFRVVLEP